MSGHGFLFSLPLSFFDSAESFSSPAQLASNGSDGVVPTASIDALKAAQQEQSVADEHAGGWSESGATCIACGIGVNSQGFTTSAEQRQHFKTDWHRYNLKRRIDKKLPVTEEEFDRMIEAGDDVRNWCPAYQVQTQTPQKMKLTMMLQLQAAKDSWGPKQQQYKVHK
eukprot:GHUV01027685.1.p1 GENE.GHUV01027685.1~~GHUV01027685.1.p1  ORF type:complete len:168 (+),score=45.90 GHUV01027685.1:260-763(+)